MFHPRRIKATSCISGTRTRTRTSSTTKGRQSLQSRIFESIVPPLSSSSSLPVPVSSSHISKRRIFSASYNDCCKMLLSSNSQGTYLNHFESFPTLPLTTAAAAATTTTIQTKSFASMPLGEERVKARNEHLKEEIFRKSTIQSTNQQLQQEEEDEDQQQQSKDTKANEKEENLKNQEEPKPRRRTSEVPISEVLKSKHTLRWVEPIIDRDSTVREAIQNCIDSGLSAMMVIDNNTHNATKKKKKHSNSGGGVGGITTSISVSGGDDTSLRDNSSVSIQRGKVVGMATSRDLLRIINGGFQDNESNEEIFNRKVGDYMTPITQVIYARPEETIGMCRRIMAKLGVKCLPILSNGRVEGLVTARDMNEFGLDAAERGGKKHYLENKSERVGLSTNTSMAEPPSYIRAHLASQQRPLFMNVGIAELPHPFKTPESCGMNRRDYGADEVADDCDLSEDAHFITKVTCPDESSMEHNDDDSTNNNNIHRREFTYVGVADGVGSWREYDIDPREFSHSLMQECDNILRENDAQEKCNQKVRSSSTNNNNAMEGDDDKNGRKMLTPAELLGKAYDRVKADNIIGSSTACIAMFDELRHQLHFSNLGDSGIIVLRHIDSDVAGALKRDKTTPRTERTSDLRVAFVSQQQLKSFNHPFQLGWTGEEICSEDSSFKTAAECCTSSIHIRRGDIIILATDGLFDNVELEDITKIALEWEQKNGFINGKDIVSREKRWKEGASMAMESAKTIGSLAKTLVDKARENSLDKSVDSPFAILAKENDIMWSGGMPDDCTIVAMHVVSQPVEQVKS